MGTRRLSMAKEKTYKKGTMVWLWCSTHDIQSMEKEEYTLEVDCTHSELEKVAEDFFWNNKEPEWGFSEEDPEEF
jgi:hypothetical protein